MSPPGCPATPPDQEGRRCLKPDVATPPGPTSPSRTPCFLFIELFAASPDAKARGCCTRGTPMWKPWTAPLCFSCSKPSPGLLPLLCRATLPPCPGTQGAAGAGELSSEIDYNDDYITYDYSHADFERAGYEFDFDNNTDGWYD